MNARDFPSGNNCFAIPNGTLVQRIVERRSRDIDVNARNVEGRTALRVAVDVMQYRNAEALIVSCGVDISIKDNMEKTAGDFVCCESVPTSLVKLMRGEVADSFLSVGIASVLTKEAE